MTAGKGIKKAAEGTKKTTEHVVDAVEGKVNDVTDTAQSALKKAADKVHGAAGQPEKKD